MSAGGTLGINVGLADANDQPLSTSLPVTFTSVCASESKATIDGTSLSVSGIARSTFEDISCAGSNGNEDIITASISLNGQQFTVSRSINIQAEAIGSISFVNAQPTNIVLSCLLYTSDAADD